MPGGLFPAPIPHRVSAVIPPEPDETLAIRGALKVVVSETSTQPQVKRESTMKRTLSIALAALALASGSAFADSQFPKPSFVDSVELPAYAITGTATIEQGFPKGSYAGGGGPKGPA